MQVGSDFQAQPAPLETSSTSPHSSVAVTLEEPDLWAKFHHAGTEMVITKTGRRMFPQFKIKVTGLISYAKYLMLVDFVPTDNFRYKWNKDQWEIAGKAEPQPPCRMYVHLDSPALGSHWMKEPVSFQKLKLTNNTLDQQGHATCKKDAGPFIKYGGHSRGDHAEKVILHVMQADGLFSTRCSIFRSFSFPETVFTSVTTYQNEKVEQSLCLQKTAYEDQITKLKIYNNPFAKGFRAHGKNVRHWFPAAGEVSLPAPFKDLSAFNEFWARPHQLDFPMAPEQDPKPHESLAATLLLPLWQDAAGMTGHTEEPVGKPKSQGLTCAPYAPDQSFSQWVIPPPSEYRVRSYVAFSAGSSGSTAGGRADWSQCPLFPYACW